MAVQARAVNLRGENYIVANDQISSLGRVFAVWDACNISKVITVVHMM